MQAGARAAHPAAAPPARAARRAARCLVLAAAIAPLPLPAAEDSGTPATAAAPAWSGGISAYLNLPRGNEAYVTGIAIAKRGALHLEARSNYEGMDAYSFFAGYNLGWGDALRLDFTPILGVVTGSTHSVVGGFEATLTGRHADAYIEFEYVPDAEPSGYAYAWSELAWRPRDWLRLGLAAQRTRVPDNGRNLQRGVFAQVKGKHVAGAVYWFNPAAHDQIAVVSIGLSF
ncbi:conserved hypothetical protein [Cupriavidus taiwanensis]|uniref:Cellulose biosynthesis protein BcsS n=1 Tax=Cupriavidus taiwanensis TaxID=164546 RepID=A0A975XFM1_9BURK|nr:hypothetical protein [Cupriavidus taiwanensis]SOY68576.1 conserved hypothetical protein [Cupriavidus taiwanensis]